eukprot:CAMPEP_0198646814 /NCGR_PEP_ID=MMETSP1467-20131203/2224_1 /TAXON_ID=1462469 /ORGANISM="unid. sp., Strain CCMP2135" /LENGTH=48 /DNA_ID= /DNA_START= /DNA_END= /DNA_ORIENTATION=
MAWGVERRRQRRGRAAGVLVESRWRSVGAVAPGGRRRARCRSASPPGI